MQPGRVRVLRAVRGILHALPESWRRDGRLGRLDHRLEMGILRRVDMVRWREAKARDLGVTIGEGCRFFSLNIFAEPNLVEFGDNVLVSGDVFFVTHDGSVFVSDPPIPHVNGNYGRIRIGNNCFIGMRAMILPGVEIGDNCIVGAGAVVMDSFPANSVIAGNPAHYVCPTSMYMEMRRHSPATIIDPRYPGPEGYPPDALLERIAPLPFRPVRRRDVGARGGGGGAGGQQPEAPSGRVQAAGPNYLSL